MDKLWITLELSTIYPQVIHRHMTPQTLMFTGFFEVIHISTALITTTVINIYIYIISFSYLSKKNIWKGVIHNYEDYM